MDLEMEITVDAQEISRLTETASDFLAGHGVDSRATHNTALVIDELLTNLATHGGAAGGRATVRLQCDASEVRCEIVDHGPPFDPFSVPDPDLTAPIEEREIGGLGLYLVRKVTSRLDYQRRDDANLTRFAVARDAAGNGGKQ